MSDDDGPGRDLGGGLAETLERLGRLSSGARERLETAAEEERRRAALDRSHIARRIVWLYIATVGFVVVLLAATFVESVWSRPDQAASVDEWKEFATVLVNALSVAVLPVVTLVLGFYFGSQNRDGDGGSAG